VWRKGDRQQSNKTYIENIFASYNTHTNTNTNRERERERERENCLKRLRSFHFAL